MTTMDSRVCISATLFMMSGRRLNFAPDFQKDGIEIGEELTLRKLESPTRMIAWRLEGGFCGCIICSPVQPRLR